MMPHPLDNPAWFALTGPHAPLALGAGSARHYPSDVAPYSAVAEASLDAYADLAIDLPQGLQARLFRPGEERAPPGWRTLSARPIVQMLADDSDLPARLPREAEIVRLGPDDAEEMLALVEIARPGPFARRTLSLGRYVGVREATTGWLMAMGGERFSLRDYVELSAIAVHPDATGRGLGAAVTVALARAAFARGKVPFLHVYSDNPAIGLYARLGFRPRTELWVLLWRRLAVDETG